MTFVPVTWIAVFASQATDPQSSQISTPPKPSETDISELHKKAEAGDPLAAFLLGQAYETGKGVAQNPEIAAILYRKAAEKGHAKAQNNLGGLYWQGEGVQRDKEEALRWYRRAALQGEASAMFNLGAAYYNGEGVLENTAQSYAWFIAAANARSPSGWEAAVRSSHEFTPTQKMAGALLLARMYRDGEEIPRNYPAAAKLYHLAVDAGSSEARVYLAMMEIGGETEVADHAEARRWCEETVKRNYAPGALCLGLLYERGFDVGQDESKALQWFRRAAEMGDRDAILRLGRTYSQGQTKDPAKAYFWFLLADAAGFPEASSDLASLSSQIDSKRQKDAAKKAANWRGQHHFLGRP